MKEVILDGRLMTSKNRLYAYLSETFNLPDHFGNNLDALWDILNEETEPTILHITYLKDFLEEMDGYGEQIVRMLTMLNQLNDHYEVYFYPEAYEREEERKKNTEKTDYRVFSVFLSQNENHLLP